MKYLRPLLLIWLVAAALTMSGRTAVDFFVSAPPSVVRLLPQSTRLDMVDYYNFKSTRTSPNSLEGPAQVKLISDGLVTLMLDSNVDMEIAVIPPAPKAKTDTVVAVITTLKLPVMDSSIEFYDKSWNKLKRQPFTPPAYSDWLTAQGRADIENLRLRAPFIPVSMAFDPKVSCLLLNNETAAMLEDSEAEALSGKMIKSKVYNVALPQFKLSE